MLVEGLGGQPIIYSQQGLLLKGEKSIRFSSWAGCRESESEKEAIFSRFTVSADQRGLRTCSPFIRTHFPGPILFSSRFRVSADLQRACQRVELDCILFSFSYNLFKLLGCNSRCGFHFLACNQPNQPISHSNNKKTLTERLKLSGQINLQDLLNSSLGLGAGGAVNPSLGAISLRINGLLKQGLDRLFPSCAGHSQLELFSVYPSYAFYFGLPCSWSAAEKQGHKEARTRRPVCSVPVSLTTFALARAAVLSPGFARL
jgi:hypothetical protein